MPKCLECGFESTRLQWTHFKYNCTGKFSNGKQYMQSYPGAKVVDDDLGKKTTINLANLVKKYGQEEGQQRWKAYKEKQAETNSFEYKKKKYGWSEEKFREYNLSRSITPETMIKKYGLEEGLRRFDSYCEKQRYTKSKEYVVGKYGEAKWEEIQSKKAAPHDPRIISMQENISVEQAVAKIAARNKTAYVSDLERQFVADLEVILGPLSHTNNNSPFGKWDHERNRYVVYDIKHGNCIIEFNGDYWHANPLIYSADDHIRGKCARDIWASDKHEIEIAQNAGFSVKVVWEHDYLNNKEQDVKEVAEWIQNTHK